MSEEQAAKDAQTDQVLEYLAAFMAVLMDELTTSGALDKPGVDNVLRSLARFTSDYPSARMRALNRKMEFYASQMLDLPPARGSRIPREKPPSQ